MNPLDITKVSDYQYQLSFNGKVLGEAERDVDGFYYWWPNKDLQGCTSSWVMRAIADHLDALNKPYEDHLSEYFSENPPKPIIP